MISTCEHTNEVEAAPYQDPCAFLGRLWEMFEEPMYLILRCFYPTHTPHDRRSHPPKVYFIYTLGLGRVVGGASGCGQRMSDNIALMGCDYQATQGPQDPCP